MLMAKICGTVAISKGHPRGSLGLLAAPLAHAGERAITDVRVMPCDWEGCQVIYKIVFSLR